AARKNHVQLGVAAGTGSGLVVSLDELFACLQREKGVDAKGTNAQLSADWLVKAARNRYRVGLRDPQYAGRTLFLHRDLLRKREAATGCSDRTGSRGTADTSSSITSSGRAARAYTSPCLAPCSNNQRSSSRRSTKP